MTLKATKNLKVFLFQNPNIRAMKKLFVFIGVICSIVAYSQPKEISMLVEASTIKLGDSIPMFNTNGYSYAKDDVLTWFYNQSRDTCVMVNEYHKSITISFPYDKISADEMTLWMMEELTMIKATKDVGKTSILFNKDELYYMITTTEAKTYIQVTL